jgi:hypothetical protein
MPKINYYSNYSQTQSLQDGFTKEQLDWGVGNYKVNYYVLYIYN